MPITLIVKPEDSEIGALRRELALRVIERFEPQLVGRRLLCFLDDQDNDIIKQSEGRSNRGVYKAIDDHTDQWWVPENIWWGHIYVDDGDRRVFDGLIYLHGTTCDDEVGLVMSLSHELQHAVQHTKNRTLWLVNTLVNSLNIKWADIPIEVDARIVSKRTAEQIFGSEKVAAYIDRRIAAPVDDNDAADWAYVRSLGPQVP